MANKKNGVHEYKDNSGDNRLHVWQSGNITIGSTEGYKNKSDMRDAAVNGAIRIIEKYIGHLTKAQLEDLESIAVGELEKRGEL